MSEEARRCVTCKRLFSYHTERGRPALPVCPRCVELRRRAIRRRLVEKTGGGESWPKK